jgi:hypothetical protein
MSVIENMIEEINCLFGFSMARTIRLEIFSMQDKD